MTRQTHIDADGATDALFKALLESAPDAMIVVNEQGQMTIVNGQAEKIFAYSREEMLGQSIEMLLPDRVRTDHLEHRAQYKRHPKLRPMGQGGDLLGKRKDGSEFSVEISLSPVEFDGGFLVCSVIRDVSARQQMEADLINAEKEAVRANKANSAFLAAASHDLRQPVQALSLLNGALRRTVKDERALAMIANQETSLTAMTNLLNSLLDISRLDAGAVTPELEDFPIQRLIDRLSSEFSRQAQSKSLKFESHGCSAIVRSDPNLLAEILNNLVANAIRYTNDGLVSLQCTANQHECFLEISDTGIGIEADQLEEIFREFYQCVTPGISQQGFGLGLAIVRRLADLLGHHIEVQSEPGTGSRFSISLPVVAAVAKPDEVVSRGPATASDGGMIILVEDDVSVADAWCLLLEAEGFRVVTAATAREAIAAVRRLNSVPDLVLSDFHLLDNSTGVDAVAAIREIVAADIPAFLVSGDTSKVVRDARLLENCKLMSKPVDTNRFLRAIHYAIRTGKVPPD